MNDSPPPLFSVLMPVYNHEQYVGEAVQSVRDQTFPDWELIVIDDGSTDSSGRIADEHAAADPRVRVVRQQNTGQAMAKNNATRLARGQWICHLDSDDKYLPDALKHYADYMAEHPDAQFLYGYRHRMDADGAVEELSPPEHQKHVTGTADLFQKTFLSQLCVCYKVDLLEKTGGFDRGLFCADDYDLNLRMSLHTRFEPIGKPTGLRRRHKGCMSAQTGRSRMLEAGILKRFVEKYGGKDLLPREMIDHRLARLYYGAGRQYFKSRCYRQAIVALGRAHQHRRTFKSVALMVLSRLLLPLGTVDGHEIPRVE